MQKKFGVNIHNVGETIQFFGTQKQSNIGQFAYDLKKMKTYNLGKLAFMYFFWGGYLLCISIFRRPKTGEEL
jgi:hypothetical protein